MIPNFFRRLYRKSRDIIFSLLDDYGWTEKQADAMATKLDIFGAFAVTQAWFGLTKYGWDFWLALAVFLLSLLFCAILWTAAFILKGYKK